MKERKRIIRIAVLFVALAGLNLWAYASMSAAKEHANRAIDDANLCQQIAGRISSLKSEPAIAGTKEQAQQQLSQEIESAARLFGVTGDNLAAIDPDPAVRAADSAYLEKPTTVQLRNVSLPQLSEIICKLSGDGTGLRVKSLRLTAPPQQQEGNLWSVEFTVTYLIYSPLPTQHGALERS